MGYSKTIAGLIVAVGGLAGHQLSEQPVVEAVGLAAELLGLGLAWYGRVAVGDVTPVGTRRRPRR
jgi:hypothetical protein